MTVDDRLTRAQADFGKFASSQQFNDPNCKEAIATVLDLLVRAGRLDQFGAVNEETVSMLERAIQTLPGVHCADEKKTGATEDVPEKTVADEGQPGGD